jgi:hypothetical protein
MAAKKIAPDTRPFYNVVVRDAARIHQAIAAGKIPLNCAPVDLNALSRWAREAFKDGLTPQALGWDEENGIEVREK